MKIGKTAYCGKGETDEHWCIGIRLFGHWIGLRTCWAELMHYRCYQITYFQYGPIQYWHPRSR